MNAVVDDLLLILLYAYNKLFFPFKKSVTFIELAPAFQTSCRISMRVRHENRHWLARYVQHLSSALEH